MKMRSCTMTIMSKSMSSRQEMLHRQLKPK
ncbi:unnamed protein product [Cylicostephanus goldi]|uniref:Uncharacterized protein n=1 Tax=Cylicostephanus goldi TaxID=71465 RepID=A0A3P6RVK2_CYLGO|nr:unnamed protein product [Cylicostephanus goldi]